MGEKQNDTTVEKTTDAMADIKIRGAMVGKKLIPLLYRRTRLRDVDIGRGASNLERSTRVR